MIAVLDYGSGNVKAFLNAYERMRIPCRAAKTPADLDGASHLILPGVGAFDTALQQFRQSGMLEIVEGRVLNQGVPLLGVCVGMQMLAHSSEEGIRGGLGWVPGRVRRLTPETPLQELRLPHMGWNRFERRGENHLLKDLPNGGRCYFLHSYFFESENAEQVIATSRYGRVFPCAVCNRNIYAVQFHPEKSHEDGMQILKNFAEI